MATTGTDTRLEDLVAETYRVAVGTRIDAPHSREPARADVHQPRRQAADAAVVAEALEVATAQPGAGEAAEQLRTQAAQLAELLRARQKDLDHREAQLNAQAATLDRDERAARLWLSERMAELEERSHIITPPPLAAPSPPNEALDAQRRHVEESEQNLRDELTTVGTLREELLRDRQSLEENQRAERERLDQQRNLMLAELDTQRQALQRRSEQVDRSKAALDEVRDELQHLHRETLEIRLATEELWAELSGSAPPAALVRSLGRIRTQLAEHYRQANEKLTAERDELETFRKELRELAAHLAEEKQQFDRWAADGRHEVEEQAERLMARQDELERNEADLREQGRQWQIERLEQQQEIRRLRAELAQRVSSGVA